jgi:alpha-tubulin suppressor-like RCC1 family protein
MEKISRATLSGMLALALSACGGDPADSPIQHGGSSASRSQEATVPPADAERLASGIQFSVGLSMDGDVLAWGDNAYGQLGNGTLSRSLVPRQVDGLSGVRGVSAGAFHVLATTQAGEVWGWGSNHYHQLGTRNMYGATRPFPIEGMSNVRMTSSNAYHNVALTRDGGVFIWGRMANINTVTPQPVRGLSGSRAVAAGFDFALALKPDGSVWGWGLNTSNQLAQSRRLNVTTEAVQVEGIDQVVAIATGFTHALALREDGSVWAWGNNTYAQVGNGNGSRPNRVEGLPLPANGKLGIKAIIASPYNSAVLYADGSVWAWGRNFHGQLGSQAGAIVRKPVRLSLPGTAAALTMSFNTILVLNTDGTVYGIGANADGQIGNNTNVHTTVPVQTSGIDGNGFLDLGKSAGGN